MNSKLAIHRPSSGRPCRGNCLVVSRTADQPLGGLPNCEWRAPSNGCYRPFDVALERCLASRAGLERPRRRNVSRHEQLLRGCPDGVRDHSRRNRGDRHSGCAFFSRTRAPENCRRRMGLRRGFSPVPGHHRVGHSAFVRLQLKPTKTGRCSDWQGASGRATDGRNDAGIRASRHCDPLARDLRWRSEGHSGSFRTPSRRCLLPLQRQRGPVRRWLRQRKIAPLLCGASLCLARSGACSHWLVGHTESPKLNRGRAFSAARSRRGQ